MNAPRIVRCKIATNIRSRHRVSERQLGPQAPISSASAEIFKAGAAGGNARLQPLARRNQIQIEREEQVTYAPVTQRKNLVNPNLT
jgi:hypothetical protein